MRLMQRDLKYYGRSTGQEIEEIMKRFLLAFCMFCLGATAFAVITIPSAKAESVIGATTEGSSLSSRSEK